MDFLKTLFPMLGTALAGPFGGVAASFIAEKLGIESKTVEAVSEVLSSGKMTPEQVSKLKLADIEFQKFCKTHQIDLAKLDVDNTKDARAMQVSIKSNIPATLAVIMTSGYFLILVLMMLGILTVADNQSLLILLGGLATGFGSVLNFYFGSSHGSAQKTEMLANKV